MDFADFDLQTASETGTWLHLDLDGLLYRQADNTISQRASDKPCRVKLRGLASSGVLEILRQLDRENALYAARVGRAKDSDLPGLVARRQEDTQRLMEKMILAAVSEWENIIVSGQEVKCEPSAVLRILGPERAFFPQVNAAILEAQRFLKRAAPG